MLHDPEMQKAGSVIYISDEKEYGHGRSIYPDEWESYMGVKWTFMSKEKKNNKARVTFRRYMALVANRKLRKDVFGF